MSIPPRLVEIDEDARCDVQEGVIDARSDMQVPSGENGRGEEDDKDEGEGVGRVVLQGVQIEEGRVVLQNEEEGVQIEEVVSEEDEEDMLGEAQPAQSGAASTSSMSEDALGEAPPTQSGAASTSMISVHSHQLVPKQFQQQIERTVERKLTATMTQKMKDFETRTDKKLDGAVQFFHEGTAAIMKNQEESSAAIMKTQAKQEQQQQILQQMMSNQTNLTTALMKVVHGDIRAGTAAQPTQPTPTQVVRSARTAVGRGRKKRAQEYDSERAFRGHVKEVFKKNRKGLVAFCRQNRVVLGKGYHTLDSMCAKLYECNVYAPE